MNISANAHLLLFSIQGDVFTSLSKNNLVINQESLLY